MATKQESERKTDPRARFSALLNELLEEFEKLVSTNAGATIAELREENEDLRDQLLEAQRRLAARVVVERAKDLLAAQLKISGEEAFRRMQKQASSRNRRLEEIADVIVVASDTAGA